MGQRPLVMCSSVCSAPHSQQSLVDRTRRTATPRSHTAQTLAAAETSGPRSPDEPNPGDTAPPASHNHQASPPTPPLALPPSHHTVAQTHESRLATTYQSSGDAGRPRKRGKLTVGAWTIPCNALICVSTSAR